MGDARITQAGVLVVSTLTPDARVTQAGVLVLSQGTAPNARITQAGALILSTTGPSTGPIRVTQVVAEDAVQYSAVPMRVTQVAAEDAIQYSAVPMRTTQVLAESAQQYAAVPMRVTSVGAELARQYSAVPMRVTQVCLEILRPEGCFTPIDETPPEVSGTVHPIRRVRRTPHLFQALDWIHYALLDVDMETGIGNASVPQPQVMLRWSDDGGHTWSNEHWLTAGKIGEYKRRLVWNRLGRSRGRLFEVVVSDPVDWTLIGARVDVKKGTH